MRARLFVGRCERRSAEVGMDSGIGSDILGGWWMVDGGDVVDDGEVLVVREWISAHVETAAFGKAGVR